MSIMDAAILSIIIANIVSILTLAVSIIIEIIENKKTRWVKTITVNGAIAHNNMVRESSAIILSLTNPLRLKDDFKLTPQEGNDLFIAIAKLEVHFSLSIKEEAELLIIIRKLAGTLNKYQQDHSQDLRIAVILLREQFFNKISIYDFADWKYIKSQIKGRGTEINFEHFYEKEEIAYKLAEQKYQLPPWGE